MSANELHVYTISQDFAGEAIADVRQHSLDSIAQSGVTFTPGSRIAIAVGSRGIANIDVVTKAAVDSIRAKGAQPFIIPAMGSHGGATAEGQREVLASYGVTEAAMGAPVVSSMEVVPLPLPGLPFQVYMARDAYQADGVVVINRVKPHTDFHGPVESGLMKMCVIGLGKHAQALEIHRFGVPGLRDYMPQAARRVLATGKILMAIGLVENARDQTMVIRAVKGEALEQTDAQLLALARQAMPSLPFDQLDLLVVDRMGKDISGTGMDTNIIGRMRIQGEPEPECPRIDSIVCSSLTEASHGNAVGMGLADFITRDFFQAIDFDITYENIVTSSFMDRGRMPLAAKNDRQAVDWALRALRSKTPDNILAARIRSTLELTSLQVSPAALAQLQASPLWQERGIQVTQAAAPLFDHQGALRPW